MIEYKPENICIPDVFPYWNTPGCLCSPLYACYSFMSNNEKSPIQTSLCLNAGRKLKERTVVFNPQSII